MTSRALRPALLGVAASAATVLLAATACSSGGDDTAAAESSDAPGSPGSAASSDEEVHQSPIEEFFGWDVSRTSDIPEEELQQMREVEERMVDCMAAQGFEYVARDPSVDPTGTSELYALPPDEFAQRYGYGITTIDVRELSERAGEQDPNSAIVEALSPEAQRAYFEAENGLAAVSEKYGEPVPANADEVPGCRAEAERAVYGDSLDKEPLPAEFNPLVEEMDSLWDRILGDPRVDAAAVAWADCMSAAGYSELQHPDDAWAEVVRRQWELYGVEAPEDVLHPPVDRRRSMVPPPVGPPRQAGQEPDPAALGELQDYEVAVALADRECRPAYEEVVTEVQDDIEQAFIDEHRAEMEQYREALSLADGDG